MNKRKVLSVMIFPLLLIFVLFTSCEKKGYEKVEITPELIRAVHQYEILTPYNSKGCAAVRHLGKWGLIDTRGKEVVPCIYDRIQTVRSASGDADRALLVLQNSLWGLLTSDGEQLLPCAYPEHLLHFEEDGVRVTDASGKTVRFVYYNLKEQLAESGLQITYNQDGRCGVLDEDGKEIVPPVYTSLQIHGKQILVEEDGFWGVLDHHGKELAPIRFDAIHAFPGGTLLVEQDGQWAVMSPQGVLLTDYCYDAVDFSPATASFVKQGDKWAVLGADGKELTDFIYDEVIPALPSDSVTGMRLVLIGDDYGAIDRNGKEVISCSYDHIDYFRSDATYACLDGKWGILRKDGKEVYPFRLAQMGTFVNGYTFMEQDGKFGILDTDGKEVQPFVFDEALDMRPGFALMRSGNRRMLVSLVEEKVIGSSYDRVFWEENTGEDAGGASSSLAFLPFVPASSPYIKVEKDGKRGYIDARGYEVLPCRYDEVTPFSREVSLVMLIHKDMTLYGYADLKGNNTFTAEDTLRLETYKLNDKRP